ncbi:Rv3235 family protein [Streptomyces sp. NPDC004111]|uniref:Rv3235 family protein n=1 Tax=Streptomyces sp. NPDC004111 TaxID=3364690 RepID=UPI0036C35A24
MSMYRTQTRPGTTRRDPRTPGAGRPGTVGPRTTGTGAAPGALGTGAGTAVRRPPRAPAPLHHQFAVRLLAVLSGERPVISMLHQVIGDAYDQLVELAPRTPFRTRGVRPVVRKCGSFSPRPDVIEAFAMIGAGAQLRAMAFRLEQHADRRWRCTAVDLGGERIAPGRTGAGV